MWKKVVEKVNGATEILVALCFATMVILVFVQISSRFFIGSSFSWTSELARYLMIWITFLGASIAFQHGAHISIDILVNKFSRKYKNVVTFFTGLIVLSFLVVLFIEGLKFVDLGLSQKASALRIPMAYVFMIMPISSVLMLMNFIDVTLEKTFFEGRKES